jgi:hypothetical protein
MEIVGGIAEGWKFFKTSFRILFKKPIFLLPIIISWVVAAGIILYARYYFPTTHSLFLDLLFVYLFVFIIAYVIVLMNLLMLEFVQQIESGERISFSKAVKELFSWDAIAVIPLAIFFATVWFVILVLEVLTSKSRGKRKTEPSLRDAARTLGGAESGLLSWFGLGLEMFEKLLRMSVFLALPAIAWENKGSFSAFRKSMEIIRKHPVEFLTAYTLTGFAAVLMALPLLPVFVLDDAGVKFSDAVWLGVLIYECVIWSLNIYLEQMSVGLLYLWHLKWEKKGGKGELSSIPKPDLLDEIYELK